MTTDDWERRWREVRGQRNAAERDLEQMQRKNGAYELGRRDAILELREILSLMSNWHWNEQIRTAPSNVLDKLVLDVLFDVLERRIYVGKKTND